MLYDRSYMKKPFSGGLRSSVDKLLILFITTFVLQIVFELFTNSGLGSGLHYEYIGFSNHFFDSGLVWSVFTYPLLHDGPLVLLANLLGLHFIGRSVESELGNANFHWLCFISLISGAMLWIVFHYTDYPSSFLSGSTSIVLSLLTYFCFTYPDRPITFLLLFVIPVTLKPKFILMGLLGLELFGFVFWELRDNSQGANFSAHLGGMLAGAFVYWFLISGKLFPSFVFSTKTPKPINPIKKTSFFTNKSGSPKPSYSVDFSNQHSLQSEVDRILDKINEKGFGTLTQAEKNTLDKAKGLLKKH